GSLKFNFAKNFCYMIGLHVLGPSGPLAVQPGGSVMLPCYVQTPIPVEELEVEWRTTDSETIVHLFQDGESQPESQDQAYHDRANFFTEDITHGNFSLLLTDVTSKDIGVYKCVVYRSQESNETLIEIKMSEYLSVSGGHVVSAYVGDDTTLNCSVHSHIPPEELQQVSWKKMDQNIIVLLFVKGEIQPESTHDRYRDRVELFNPEEIHKGNLSMKLTNVQTGDKGLYICEVLNGALSANTTVEILHVFNCVWRTGCVSICGGGHHSELLCTLPHPPRGA
uniref:Ig-like domain-containing protein n=1 Tax=Electrophorus electricus TaxID=8005 RepID=A0A4W4F1S4_ELEEL